MRVLVIVHGAGKQLPNYADNVVAAVAGILGAEPLYVPVYYADIGNVGAPLLAPMILDPEQPPVMAEPPQVSQFKMAFAMQVQTNLDAMSQTERVVSYSTLSAQFLAELIATELNQIIGYLFSQDVYTRIQGRMSEGLDKAAALGDEIVIAAHSMGSLVAFDALRAAADKYRVSSFLSMGSPLAILRRMGARGPELGAISYATVREWLNLYDTTDPVSNPLGPQFPLHGYRLRDVFVDVAPLPPASHDYFHNAEALGIIASALC